MEATTLYPDLLDLQQHHRDTTSLVLSDLQRRLLLEPLLLGRIPRTTAARDADRCPQERQVRESEPLRLAVEQLEDGVGR